MKKEVGNLNVVLFSTDPWITSVKLLIIGKTEKENEPKKRIASFDVSCDFL